MSATDGQTFDGSCPGCGQSGSWPKMFPAFYPSITDVTSGKSSATWFNSGMAWLGESETPSFSAFHSDEGGSLSSQRTVLADVLEANVAPKFYLSAKAAAGILRRAKRRGKALPAHLEAALVSVAGALTPTE